jgi:hypothetical protein
LAQAVQVVVEELKTEAVCCGLAHAHPVFVGGLQVHGPLQVNSQPRLQVACPAGTAGMCLQQPGRSTPTPTPARNAHTLHSL